MIARSSERSVFRVRPHICSAFLHGNDGGEEFILTGKCSVVMQMRYSDNNMGVLVKKDSQYGARDHFEFPENNKKRLPYK